MDLRKTAGRTPLDIKEFSVFIIQNGLRYIFTRSVSVSIQIFGTKKCSDTRKAERFFKERGIKYQFIDLKEKGMSKGELLSVAQANGGIDACINPDAKDKDVLALLKYISDEDKIEKLLENQLVLLTPVVRNGRLSSIGYKPEIWKEYIQ